MTVRGGSRNPYGVRVCPFGWDEDRIMASETIPDSVREVVRGEGVGRVVLRDLHVKTGVSKEVDSCRCWLPNG